MNQLSIKELIKKQNWIIATSSTVEFTLECNKKNHANHEQWFSLDTQPWLQENWDQLMGTQDEKRLQDTLYFLHPIWTYYDVIHLYLSSPSALLPFYPVVQSLRPHNHQHCNPHQFSVLILQDSIDLCGGFKATSWCCYTCLHHEWMWSPYVSMAIVL